MLREKWVRRNMCRKFTTRYCSRNGGGDSDDETIIVRFVCLNTSGKKLRTEPGSSSLRCGGKAKTEQRQESGSSGKTLLGPRSTTENRKESKTNPLATHSRRRKNQDYRPREHLTESEVERLISAALKEGHKRRQDRTQGRHGGDHSLRNALMILVAYRHAFRPGELVRLRWDDIDWQTQTLCCRRLKNGIDSVHPLSTRVLKFLRRLKNGGEPSRYVFMSERGSPITTDMFRKLVQRLGEAAGFDFALHPHMLRHSAGHVLVSKGVPIRSLQLFMGHKQIQNTTKYAQLSPNPFKNFWKD
jgi:integrase